MHKRPYAIENMDGYLKITATKIKYFAVICKKCQILFYFFKNKQLKTIPFIYTKKKKKQQYNTFL